MNFNIPDLNNLPSIASKEEVSKNLYQSGTAFFDAIVNNNNVNGILNNTKILKTLNLIVAFKSLITNANRRVLPAVNLSVSLNNIITVNEKIFTSYLMKKLSVTVYSLENMLPTVQGFKDDEQTNFIFIQTRNGIEKSLNDYLNSDQEMLLEKTKLSLEALFLSMISSLQPYRSYYTVDIFSAFSSFKQIDQLNLETAEDRGTVISDQYQNIDKSIALNNVNINNPIDYDSNKTWKNLYVEFRNLVKTLINQNKSLFYVKNSIYESCNSIIKNEDENFNSIINKITNFSIKVDSNLKVVSLGVSNNTMNNEIFEQRKDEFLNQIVFYYNSNNVLTQSKITEINFTPIPDEPNKPMNRKNITLKLNPFTGGISSINQILRFLTIKNGFTIEKDFSSFTINKNSPKLFDLEITSGSIVVKNFSFSADDSSFTSNLVSLPNATLNPINNGWNINVNFNEEKFFEKNFQQINLNKNNINLFSMNIIFENDRTEIVDFKSVTNNHNLFSSNLFQIATDVSGVNVWSKYRDESDYIDGQGTYFNNQLTRKPEITVTKDFRTNKYILNKTNSNLNVNSGFSTEFEISNYDLDSDFNVSFDYEILTPGLSTSDVSFKIIYTRPFKASTIPGQIYNSKDLTIISHNLTDVNPNILKTANFSFKSLNRNDFKNYRFLIHFPNNKEIKIRMGNIYIGRDSILQRNKTYNSPYHFIDDLKLINNSYSQYFVPLGSTNSFNDRIKFSLNLSQNNIKQINFTNINSSLSWLFEGYLTLINKTIVNPVFTFTRTANNLFYFYKNNSNFKDSTVFTNFTVNNPNTTINVKFTYKILNSDFNSNDISISIYQYNSSTNLNKTLIKTLSPLLSNKINQDVNYSDSFTSRLTGYSYRFEIKINNDNIKENKINFNNFYIGTSTSTNSLLISNPNQLLNILNKSNSYKNNNSFRIGYRQNTNTNQNNVTTVTYKMFFTSNPYYKGSDIKFTFSNVNSGLDNFFNTNNNYSYFGVSPFILSDTGKEKKYYNSFISITKKIFGVLNAYALARLIVSPTFDEDAPFLRNVLIPKNIKSYVDELFDETSNTTDFKSNFEKDPRSKFMPKGANELSEKELKWTTWLPNDALGLKKFKKFQNDLQKIRSSLKKAQSVIETIKRFISILEELIELGEDLLGALLDEIIRQISTTVDNIASTGFYWLPVIEYYFNESISGKLLNFLREYYTTDSNIVSPFSNDVGSPQLSNQFSAELLDINKGNSLFQRDSLLKESGQFGIDRSTIKLLYNEYSSFQDLLIKSTTYDEFIEVIIEGLLDSDDLPALGMRSDSRNIFDLPNILKPGAPTWSAGTPATVVLVAFIFPSIEDGFLGGLSVINSIIKSINFVRRIFVKNFDETDDGLGNVGTSERETAIESWSELKDLIISDKSEDSLLASAYDFANDYIIDALITRNGKLSGSRGKYPDFYGISLGSVVPGIFSIIKATLYKFKKFNEKEGFLTLSEKFDLLIGPIDTLINEISAVIKGIDTLITFIETLSELNVYMLTIKTDGGIPDIVNQIRSATGFPGEDRKQIILGGLIGSGTYNADSDSFNFNEYYKTAAKEFSEDRESILSELKVSNEENGMKFLDEFFSSKKVNVSADRYGDIIKAEVPEVKVDIPDLKVNTNFIPKS